MKKRAFLLLLLALTGATGAWGQSTGLYYIANNGDGGSYKPIGSNDPITLPFYNSSTPESNLYLVPASNGGDASIALNRWAWGSGANQTNPSENTPLVTTNQTNQDNNSLWVIKEREANTGEYYLIHVLTGKYMKRNAGVGTKSNRRAFHMEATATSSLGDDHLFVFTTHTVDNTTFYSIRAKSLSSGHRYLNPSKGNRLYYFGLDTEKKDDITYYVGGLIGLYNNSAVDNDGKGSKWFLEQANLLSAPTINYSYNQENDNFTITITHSSWTQSNPLPDAYDILYTTNGDDPAIGGSTTQTYTGAFPESACTVKAVVAGHGLILTEVATKQVALICATPLITRNGMTFSISCDTPTDASLYYSLDNTTPTTLYNGPVSFTSEQLPMTVTAVAKHDGYTDSEPATYTITANGNGTESDPYLIYSDSDFASFVSNVNAGGTAASAYYKLEVDVSASSVSAITTTFSGTFDGGMHTISNLGHPLFNTINGGTVKNVMLSGVNITTNGDAGAIANTASGATRIYNCGVLGTGSTISGSGKVGSIVGSISDNTRVVNCYSFAKVTGGTHAAGIVGYNSTSTDQSSINSAPMVMSCMFYGDIEVTASTSISPIYGGQIINNTKLSNYNYFLYESPYIQNNLVVNGEESTRITYNCALAAKEEYLTRYEFFRYQLNSIRELTAWYATGSVQNAHSVIAKWVIDKSIADYPILKMQGTYPTVVNYDNYSTDYNSKVLGTLTVNIQMGNGGAEFTPPTGAAISTEQLTLNITDKDPDNYNYNYYKVQLPYYNQVGTGNYTHNRVVTGWKIVGITGGTPGTFKEENSADGYNFADRYCTQKDLYSVSKRVFNQGAYFNVPDGVTAITIEPYWAKAVYVSDPHYDVVISDAWQNSDFTNDYLTSHGLPERFTDGQAYTINGCESQTVYTGISLQPALEALSPQTSGRTVYDYAVVLVGNYHLKNGEGLVGTDANKNYPFTIMSADLDFDNEPDYGLIYNHPSRKLIPQVRFDFLNCPGVGWVQKPEGSVGMRVFGIFEPLGWFEVTNTCVVYFDQFECASKKNIANTALILQGGVYHQITSVKDINDPNKTSYILVGDNAKFEIFNYGCHNNQSTKTYRRPISVMGGEYDKFYLSGYYNAREDNISNNHANCFVNGGKFGEMAGAGMESVNGNVIWKIDHADIDNFYGGGINHTRNVKGDISVTINNSNVGTYCGGPKFGNMESGKTVTTNAQGSTFGNFFGAGFGGTSINRQIRIEKKNENATDNNIRYDLWPTTVYTRAYTTNTTYQPNSGDEQNVNGINAIATGYDDEYFYESGGNKAKWGRFYVNYASLSLATTNDVTTSLKDCDITGDFYGGGNLGKVEGDISSTLENCRVNGNVFGGGYSATTPTVEVYPHQGYATKPTHLSKLGMFKKGVPPTAVTYTWAAAPEGFTFSDNTNDPQPFDETNHLIYTDVPLTSLGQVHGNVTLSIIGNTKVLGDIFGGGDESAVVGTTTVNIETSANANNAQINNVFGGGNQANVKVKDGATGVTGTTTVNILGNTRVTQNVYGGGNEGSVENMTNVNLQGGTINGSVYGASKGRANREDTTPENPGVQSAPAANADVKNYTNVTMTAGTVNGSVFGGGENGSVGLSTCAAADATSTVSINGGLVKGSVFAGGAFGFTKGITIANVSGNSVINTNVYGGAYGALGRIYVAGMHIVNMRGGTVYGSVYGGSYNANDGLNFDNAIVFNENPKLNDSLHVSVVNMSGGTIHGHLFASGFFGKAAGSTYAFIGRNAIIQAPHHVIPHPDPNSTYNIEPGVYNGSGPYNGHKIPGSYYNVSYYNKEVYGANHLDGENYVMDFYDDHKALIIEGNVWAGADYGELGANGFGASTITGRSNIYINGNGYDTSSDTDNTQPTHDNDYMNILGSVYGCGTSCDGGVMQRDIFFRNYGKLVANLTYNQNYNPESPSGSPEPWLKATRNIYSFQNADELIIDDSHIQLLGQRKVTSTDATRKYSLYNFTKFANIVNGSSLFIDYPFDEIQALGSYYCEDVYAEDVFGDLSQYHVVNYNELNGKHYDNKIRINKGTYLKVGHMNDTYDTFINGQLEGFFYLMADADNQSNAYAYARFKTSNLNQDDGGFVSYDNSLNTFNASGNPAQDDQNRIQIPYTNYIPSDLTTVLDPGIYYRAWRYMPDVTTNNRECVLNAIADPEHPNDFSTVSVSIDLLPTVTQDDRKSYYVIKNVGTTATPVGEIDWGDEATLLPLGYTYTSYNLQGPVIDWMAYENGHTENGVPAFTLPYTPGTSDANLTYMHNHPNSAFGLSAIPTGGLTGNQNNTPWLICPDAHDVLMRQRWSTDAISTGASNTMSLLLTYSNAIDGNYAWDPVYITLQHAISDGNGGTTVLDEIKIKITITTTTSIVQNIETKTFALMQGKGETHDNFNSKMLLPHYTLHEVGENFSDWYLTGVEWRPNTDDGFSATTLTKVGDEYQSNNDTWNKTHFAMTMMATYNFDNSLGWFDTGDMVDLGDHLVTNFTEPIFIGNTDGRSNISLLVSMKYDGNIRLEDAEADDKVFGHIVMHLKYTNYSGGDENNNWSNTIDFTVEAIRRGTSNVFFIDGVNGKMDYSGKYPDAAKASLASLLYATDEFQAGDIIYVVDKVTAKSDDGLAWNSQPFSSVDIYRYPGGHVLAPSTEKRFENYNTVHPNNPAYLGPLVEVQTSMSVSALVLDGSYDPTGTYGYYSNEPTHNVNANSPLIEVMPGGTLSVLSGNNEQILYKTVLKHNYNANSNSNGNGGAILVHEGGNVRLSDNTIIKENRVDGDGGGVYLTSGANMILSDLVTVKDNMKVSSGTLTENNIYLDGYNTTANIGTQNPSDIYGALSQNSRVGFTKTDWQSGKDYMPVLYSDDENFISPLFRSNIVFDDRMQNTLEKYPEDLTNHPEYFDQKLYFVNTWVNYQSSAPSGFRASDIDTPQELAWAISLANGRLDGSVTAAPSQNFTITADIDMSEHIWVPIGNGENPYIGTFNANGHIIKGLQSSLSPEHLGLIGMLGENGNVKNVIANATFEDGIPTNVGTVVGTMTGGTVDKCEALGTLNGGTNTVTMGGLVGKADGGLIVNSMSMVTLNADNDDCSSGGLVGLVGQMANLKNSFSHFTLNHTGFGPAGGLAGTVNGNIHNCYALLRSGGTYNSDYYRSFASAGNGTISHCYAKTTDHDYVKGSITNTNYGAFTDAVSSFSYGVGKEGDGNRVNDEPLVNKLNAQCTSSSNYSGWMRTLGSPINGDYPILRFDNYTTVASPDNVMLEYSNDLSNICSKYSSGNLLVYGTNNNNNITSNNMTLYVDENVAVTQSINSDVNAYLGVTMDNSNGSEELGGKPYDWHMFSSPLTAAPLGINYGTSVVGYGNDPSFTLDANVDAYIPSNTPVGSFDLYSYFEEQYHWINLKRNSNNHWHDDLINGVHQRITYTNETNFTPGKGYLVAIDQETFLQSHGTLNNGEVTIPVTKSTLLESYAFMSGYNLIGNPYQSYLDFKAFAGLTDATSGLNTLLSTPSYTILDADENGYKSYAVDASTGADVASRYIHPHQGFFVVTSGSGNLTFNNNMRSLTGQGSSFRGDELPAYPLINLHAIDAEGRKEIVVVETGRPQLGGALKMKALRVADAYFYAQYDKKDYSVLFTPAGANEVPLGFEAQKSGQFTLSWDTHNEGFTYLHLVDNLTGADIDCLSENEYRFESSVSDYASRFKLVFSICEDADDDSEPFAYYNGSTWVISNEGRATLQVIDALGRVIYNEQIEGNVTCNPSTVPGVYLMRLIGSEETKVQKVIVR